ncbi:MYXO-CTERM sorting domain-containing protein [Haliangium sp.]|uniref:MYXO-CTERM sorting domain-containing protein n=1 Tax=Haliangium sp. TaxID=2663208 RepID=UPI003D0D127C
MLRRHASLVPGLVVFALALLGLLVGRTARADWPLPRADAARTGATEGRSDLRAPVPYWRYYLGGAIGTRGAVFVDVDDDDTGEVVFTAGGKLIAKEIDDELVWETTVPGLAAIVGLADLDGSGRDELIVHSRNRVFVVEPGTGRVLWAQPDDDLGTLGGARVGDLDGDGLADLLVQECGCCRINNGKTGFAYRFAGGYQAAERMWTLPSVLCGGYLAMSLVDVDAGGGAEVVLGEQRRIVVLDGASGAERAASPDLGERVGEARCLPVALDERAGEELLCLHSSSIVSAEDPGHRLYALRYRDDGPGARLEVMWTRDVGERNGGARLGATPVLDLDGDGALEVAVSGTDNDGAVSTILVLDALTGAVRATLAGEQLVGTAAIDVTSADGKRAGPGLVITTRDDELRGYALAGDELVRQWSLPGRRALLEPDWDLAARAFPAEQALLLDLDDSGGRELVTVPTSPGGALDARDLAGDVIRGRHELGPAGAVLAAWRAPALPGQAAALVVAPSDGRMQVLDRSLAPLARGLRFGGYAPLGDWRKLHLTAVTGDLGTGADSIVITDAGGALVRLDAAGASLAVPPMERWAVTAAAGPILLPDPLSEGEYAAVACRQTLPDGDHRVLVVDRDGRERWRADLPGVVLSDLVPARLDRDGALDLPDLIVQWGLTEDRVLEHRAFAGADGAVLWDAAPQSPGSTRFPAGGAVVDWDRDGVDDFVHQHYGMQVLSGVDGSELAAGPDTGLVYFMPTVVELDGDPAAELVLHGGFSPVRALDDDLSTPLWVSPDDSRPYPYGAIAAGCDDGAARLVEGSLAQPATLSLTPLSGPGAGVPARVVLAGGKAYPDEAAARAAGAFLGQLNSAVVHRDLTGAGRPVAVLGSEDGWLYAVDGCTAELAFAVPLGAAVGAVAFADSDGDGKDEILAAAGDGFLYALAEAPIAAPAVVVDVDPAAALDPEPVDIDVAVARDRMAARWSSVDGADGYQVAVVDEELGQVVSEPPWRDLASADTWAVVTGLELVPGRRYHFAVRATLAGAPSPDAMSDGVSVDGDAGPPPLPPPPGPDEPPTPGEPGSGCGCRSADPGTGAPVLVLVLGVLAAIGRRRRRGEGHAGARCSGRGG